MVEVNQTEIQEDPDCCFLKVNVLLTGHFGCVYRGFMRLENEKEEQEVAIKTLKSLSGKFYLCFVQFFWSDLQTSLTENGGWVSAFKLHTHTYTHTHTQHIYIHIHTNAHTYTQNTQTRSSAQGNCSAKSLAASVMSSILPCSSILPGPPCPPPVILSLGGVWLGRGV